MLEHRPPHVSRHRRFGSQLVLLDLESIRFDGRGRLAERVLHDEFGRRDGPFSGPFDHRVHDGTHLFDGDGIEDWPCHARRACRLNGLPGPPGTPRANRPLGERGGVEADVFGSADMSVPPTNTRCGRFVAYCARDCRRSQDARTHPYHEMQGETARRKSNEGGSPSRTNMSRDIRSTYLGRPTGNSPASAGALFDPGPWIRSRVSCADPRTPTAASPDEATISILPNPISTTPRSASGAWRLSIGWSTKNVATALIPLPSGGVLATADASRRLLFAAPRLSPDSRNRRRRGAHSGEPPRRTAGRRLAMGRSRDGRARETRRSLDGGYADVPGQKGGSTYATFLTVLKLRGDQSDRCPMRKAIRRFLQSRQRADGGFVERWSR